MKLHRWRTYGPYILLLAMMLVFAGYLWRNAHRYRQLLDLSTSSLLLLIGMVLVFTLGNGLINYLLYRELDAPLTFNEGIGLAVITTLANQLPFAGGVIAKGVYLKQQYDLAYARFLSANLALYVCFVAANGAVGIVVLGYLALVQNLTLSIPLILGYLGMALSLSLFWIPFDARLTSRAWGRRFAELLDGWRVLNRNRLLLWELVGVQVFLTLMFAARLWVVYHALSQDVMFSHCILFASATILTRLVSITPGGLGIREAIVAAVGSVLGFDAGVSVVAVSLDRLVAIMVVAILGVFYSYVLGKTATAVSRAPSDDSNP